MPLPFPPARIHINQPMVAQGDRPFKGGSNPTEKQNRVQPFRQVDRRLERADFVRNERDARDELQQLW